jgi:hypothetical protein
MAAISPLPPWRYGVRPRLNVACKTLAIVSARMWRTPQPVIEAYGARAGEGEPHNNTDKQALRKETETH